LVVVFSCQLSWLGVLKRRMEVTHVGWRFGVIS
jgi:hypothetical protein